MLQCSPPEYSKKDVGAVDVQYGVRGTERSGRSSQSRLRSCSTAPSRDHALRHMVGQLSCQLARSTLWCDMVNQVEMVTALRQELSIRQLAKEKPSAVISDHNCRPCSSRHCTADHLPTVRFTMCRARGVVICAGMPAACGRSGVTSRAKWFQPDYSAPRMLDLILTEIASSPAHGR